MNSLVRFLEEPILSNTDNVSCSGKQHMVITGFELAPEELHVAGKAPQAFSKTKYEKKSQSFYSYVHAQY